MQFVSDEMSAFFSSGYGWLMLTFAVILFGAGAIIGDKQGFNRGIQMMSISDCDEETAREVNQLLKPSGN
jgi:hypothetical protein